MLNDLLQIPSNLTNNLYEHDVVDVTRQMIQNKIDQLYPRIVEAYTSYNLTALQLLTNRFEELLNDLDRILATHQSFLLGKWIESAKAIASHNLEATNFEFNARNQITIWGPNGEIVDYAMKQWAGMVADYCLPRWQLFFKELQQSTKIGKRINSTKVRSKIFKTIEEPFSTDRKIYPIVPSSESTLDVARVIHDKWGK